MFIFRTTHSHGDNLQGFIAQETKDRVIKEQQRKKLEETKKIRWKKLSRVKNFLQFCEQKLSRILNLDYALAETFAKNAKDEKIAKRSVR